MTSRRARLATLAKELGAAAKQDAALADYAGIGVGGPADLLVVAETYEVLVQAVHGALAYDLPWRVYGGLTNILVPDTGLRGVIILNHVRDVVFQPDYRVEAASGAVVVQVAREAVRRGWGGMTWAVGLPGTIGGAVVNNAGAFGGEIAKLLTEAEILGPDGDVHQVPVAWFDFHYRCSKLKGAGQRWLVLKATFQLRPGNPDHLKTKAAEYTERRRRTQPPGKTLGSTFKNPPGDYAGRLIEAAGLKGTRRGGLVISEHHANFFINEGGGTAADFRALVALVQTTVYEQFGVMLEPEIEILPEA